MDNTHDVNLQSWVSSANDTDTEFPIQNLPFGIFARSGEERRRVGVAIGDSVLDLFACAAAGLLDGLSQNIIDACGQPRLNDLMSLGRAPSKELRAALSDILRNDSDRGHGA